MTGVNRRLMRDQKGVWCRVDTKEEGAKCRERFRVTVPSDYNRNVLQSIAPPLEIVLNASLWTH